MKYKNTQYKKVVAFSVIASLTLLPSCALLDWVKEQFGGGQPTPQEYEKPMMPENGMPEKPEVPEDVDEKDVLVWMGDKPLITLTSLQAEKKDLMESNPQLRAMVAFMDEKQLDRNLTDGLTNQAVVDKYVADNKISDRDEYKQELKRMMRSVRHMLNTKFFSQGLDVAVNDSEVKSFYDKNKETMPNLLVSRGGIKAMGVQFDTEQQAQDFAKKVRDAGENLQKTAETAGMKDKVKDFQLINDQSDGIDVQVREKVVKVDAFPSTHVFKGTDNKLWVIHAAAKENPKYRPLGQVKADLKEFLKKEKHAQALEKEINRLKEEYKVVIKEDYFATDDDANKYKGNPQPAFKTAGHNEQRNAEGARVADSKKRPDNVAKTA